jgi:hypothetical protein
MPDPVKFFRVTALPPVPVVDSIYYVFDGVNTETYVVGNDGIARRDYGLIQSIGEGVELVGSELRLTIETLPAG